MSRRGLLVSVGAASAATIAGCSGKDTDGIELQPLEIYGYGGAKVLSQTETTVTLNESEPNDQRETAMQVDLGSTVEGDLTTAEVDWYAFDASSGQNLVVEFNRASVDGVTSVVLYGPGGDYRDLVFVGVDEPAQVIETAKQSGTHFVEIVDIQNSDGKYTLSITTGSESTPTPTPTQTATTTSTSTATATPLEDDYGEQEYGQYGYGGVTSSTA